MYVSQDLFPSFEHDSPYHHLHLVLHLLPLFSPRQQSIGFRHVNVLAVLLWNDITRL